jgi:hypothetical protein
VHVAVAGLLVIPLVVVSCFLLQQDNGASVATIKIWNANKRRRSLLHIKSGYALQYHRLWRLLLLRQNRVGGIECFLAIVLLLLSCQVKARLSAVTRDPKWCEAHKKPTRLVLAMFNEKKMRILTLTKRCLFACFVDKSQLLLRKHIRLL